MALCIWVLISYIQQGRQSHAHASSTTRSILSYYSSEIPRVLSTSDEMSITQMRRTLVYGPPGVESRTSGLGICAANIPRPSVVIEREGFAASSWGMVEIDVGRDR